MTREPVRVCHVITGLELGGAETMLAKLCAHAPRDRLAQSVVSLRGGGPLAERLRASGAGVVEGTMRPGSLPTLREVQWLSDAIRQSRPQVVQGWMYHANLAAALARPRRVPVVWNVRQTLYDLRREKRLTRAMIRAGAALSFMPQAILYNSTLSARQHEAIGFRPARTRVLPNGFDVERFSPAAADPAGFRAEIGAPPGALLVGLIARAHPMKDHATFFAAAQRVAGCVPGVRFVLAGEGTTPDAPLARLIPTEMLRERMHLLGARRDTERITASLDVACSSSAWGEGFPNVLGEAMACGVPCVATDVGDSAYVVGEAGRIVPPGAPEALAEAVLALLADPEARRRMGAAGRDRVTRLFSIGRIADRYADLYDGLAHGRTGLD